MRCLILSIWFVSFAFASAAQPQSQESPVRQRVAITTDKVSLTLALMDDVVLKDNEPTFKLLYDDVVSEVDSLKRWFDDPKVLVAGTHKNSAGLPESETAAFIRGKVDEMRSALDGYGARLPTNASNFGKIQLVKELAEECEQLVADYSKRMLRPGD